MGWFIVGAILFVLNLIIGIFDVKAGKSTKSTAFTWFVVGFLTWDLLHQLPSLFS